MHDFQYFFQYVSIGIYKLQIHWEGLGLVTYKQKQAHLVSYFLTLMTTEKERRSLKKWLILGLGQEKVEDVS